MKPQTIGGNIKRLREERNLTQKELAKKMGISASAVGMYEQGRREPSLALLVELSKVFSVTTDFLLTGSTCTEGDRLRASQAVDSCKAQLTGRLRSRGASALTAEEFSVLLAAVVADS